MATRLRPFALLALTVVAIVVYNARIRHEMVDFLTWRQAAVRGLHAETLYRLEDGHYSSCANKTHFTKRTASGKLERGPGPSALSVLREAVTYGGAG